MGFQIIALPSALILASFGFGWPQGAYRQATPELGAFTASSGSSRDQPIDPKSSVLLAIDVDEAGEVERVEVIEPAGQAFDEVALNAATHFRFDPSPGRGPTRILYRYER